MKRTSLLVVLLLSFIALPVLHSQPADSDAALWSYLQRQSQVWYTHTIAQTGLVPAGDWQGPIESAFLRLAGSSGEPGFQIQYAVLKGDGFNAAAFPGGQFIINKGTLVILDKIIEAQFGKPLGSLSPAELAATRSALIAAILAHELGHYYHRHSFNSMKKSWNLIETNKENLDLSLIKYSQENEFEADRTAYLLLQKAGYNPDFIVLILEILNQIQQGTLKGVSATTFNVYLQTHPSPHQRLAQFAGKNREWHTWAAEMEGAVSDIALGRNLDKAVATLDKALTAMPDNLYLLKARAVALHKQWLATVSLKDQKLRAVIDLPAFRDEMVYSRLQTRGMKRTPGDLALFLKAKEAYRKSYLQSVDPGFTSNFAVLLAYSTDAKDQTECFTLAQQACLLQTTYQTASNFALVLFLLDLKKESLQLFGEIAADYKKSYSAFLTKAALDPGVLQSLQTMRQQMKLTQQLNPEYVYADFTPVLNYAIVLALMDQADAAKTVASDYLSAYESRSRWAELLSTLTGVSVPIAPQKKYLAVDGIRIGSTIKSINETWGKASEIGITPTGDECWYFEAKKARLHLRNGIIYTIELLAGESPKADGAWGVGTSRADIEKAFGAHKRIASQYFIYEGPQDIAVLYANDVAAVLVLF